MKPIPDIDLSLSTEQICFIIVKAREFEAKEAPSGLSPGSNPSDDAQAAVLEMRRDDPVFEELQDFISSLNEDQQVDLVALTWIERGDFTFDEWEDARQAASDAREGPTADYLLGIPMLPEYLEEALSDLGRSCEDEEMGRL